MTTEQNRDETPAKTVKDIFSGFTPMDHPAKPRREPKLDWSGRAVRMVIAVAMSLLAFAFLILKPMLDGNITGWTPSVGDCVTAAYSDADVKDVKRVDCADGEAANKVIGVFQSRDEAEFEGPDNPCLPAAGSVQSIFYGKPHNGFILCLAEN